MSSRQGHIKLLSYTAAHGLIAPLSLGQSVAHPDGCNDSGGDHCMELSYPAIITHLSAVIGTLEGSSVSSRLVLLIRAHVEYGIMGYFYKDIAREMVCTCPTSNALL